MVTPLLTHWSYVFLALSHRYHLGLMQNFSNSDGLAMESPQSCAKPSICKPSPDLACLCVQVAWPWQWRVPPRQRSIVPTTRMVHVPYPTCPTSPESTASSSSSPMHTSPARRSWPRSVDLVSFNLWSSLFPDTCPFDLFLDHYCDL